MIRAMNDDTATIEILIADQWDDYALLDSGNLLKLERFGPYCFVRPEPQAMWKPRLDASHWQADGTFIASQTSRRDGEGGDDSNDGNDGNNSSNYFFKSKI